MHIHTFRNHEEARWTCEDNLKCECGARSKEKYEDENL